MKFKTGIAVSAVLALHILVSTFLYWAFFDRGAPVEVVSQPVVLSQSVKPGDTVLVKWSLKGLRECPSVFHQAIVGDLTYPLQSFRWAVRLGEVSDVVTQFTFPREFPPGSYAVRVVMDFACNPLRVLSVQPKDAAFEVVQIKP